MKAHSRSRGIAPLIHNLGTMEDGEWSNLRPRTFAPPSRGITPVPIECVEALRYKPEGSIPDGFTGIFR